MSENNLNLKTNSNENSELESIREQVKKILSVEDKSSIRLCPDMLRIGKIIDSRIIVLDDEEAHIFDLAKSLRLEASSGKIELSSTLILMKIDPASIEPRLPLICLQYGNTDLLNVLLAYGSDISYNQYYLLMECAMRGNLELIQKILQTYLFPKDSIAILIMKICVAACTKNKVNVLEYFLPESVIEQAPIQFYLLFFRSIENKSNIDVVKFFISRGLQLSYNNYKVIQIAAQYNNREVLEYFYSIDQSILEYLTPEQKEKYGFVLLPTVNKILPLDTECAIYHEPIEKNSDYYQCQTEKHYYGGSAWDSWCKRNSNWRCPICQSDMIRIRYINRDTI